MNSLSQYEFGGRPVTSINLLLMISEMEGTYQHLKYMGFKEDMDTINEMKQKYYKMYFRAKKEESANQVHNQS
tara:strand:- start:53 stop:271 length:219 start_codon:yes stop_codon:yes gene_type:complete